MNLTCEDLVDLMLDFVGEGLPDEQVAAIKAHLCGCQPCEGAVKRYRFTITMSRSLCTPCEPLPAGVETKLRASLGLNPGDHG